MKNSYSIADAKLAEIFGAIQPPSEHFTHGVLRELILADRMGREVYQRWLDAAPAAAIAAWVTAELKRTPNASLLRA